MFLLMSPILILRGKDSLESASLNSHRQWITSGTWGVAPAFLLTVMRNMKDLLTQSYSELSMKTKDPSCNSQGTEGDSTLLIQ